MVRRLAGPWIAEVAPGAILAGGSGMPAVGAFSSYVLFALGWVLFGIAGWKTGTFPACAGAAFVVAGVLGFNAGLPPYGIPIGLAMAALGWWIHRSSRAPARRRQAYGRGEAYGSGPRAAD